MSCPQRIWELWAQILLVPALFSSLLATSLPPPMPFFSPFFFGWGRLIQKKAMLTTLSHLWVWFKKSVVSSAEASQIHHSYYSHAQCRGCFPLRLRSLACMTEMVDDKVECHTEYCTPRRLLSKPFFLNKHISNLGSLPDSAYLRRLYIDWLRELWLWPRGSSN